MVWPSDLAAYYPVKPHDDPTTEATLAGVFLAFCTLLVFNARHRHPYLLMGWLWYLGTLVLVVLRLQAGSFTWADRYTYVPMIGIFIALVWGLCDWLERFRRTLIVGFAAVLLACLALTWQQVKIWQNSETLWTHTLAVTDADHNFLASVSAGPVPEGEPSPGRSVASFRESGGHSAARARVSLQRGPGPSGPGQKPPQKPAGAGQTASHPGL